jgi:hypothetical protein
LESVTLEESENLGKLAKHIKPKGTSQKLFQVLRKTGRPIPTAKQFKSRKGKSKGNI